MLDPLVDAHERGSSGRGAGPERRATLPFAPPLYHSDSRALLHQLQSLRRPALNRAPEQRTRTSPMITLLPSYGPVTTPSGPCLRPTGPATPQGPAALQLPARTLTPGSPPTGSAQSR